MEALRGDIIVPELAKRHDVHLNQIYGWKELVVDNAASLFARRPSASGEGEEAREHETAKLLQQDRRAAERGAVGGLSPTTRAMEFCNYRRPHQAMSNQGPMAVSREVMEKAVQVPRVWGPVA
jgi:transposase-like protein